MGRFVSVSKAAQLAGISAQEIQAEIENGKLSSVRGMIHIDDLTDVHPNADVDTADMVSWVSKIRQHSFQHIEDKQLSELTTQELRQCLNRANAELAYHRDHNSELESLLRKITYSLDDIKSRSSEPNKIQSLIALIEQKLSH